jgi:rhamnulokinase
MPTCLALDFGSSSVRLVEVSLSGDRFQLTERTRIPNRAVLSGGHKVWDYERLFAGIEQALTAVAADGAAPLSIGADSWGVDYALVDGSGGLAASPFVYRDSRIDGWMERWQAAVCDDRALFAATGVQGLPINTLYQLYAHHHDDPEAIRRTSHVLLTADYVHYWLSGEAVNERTLASTSQMMTLAGDWWEPALAPLGLPEGALGAPVVSGTPIGGLRSSLSRATGLGGLRVVVPASHDTQSAVVAVPATGDGDWAYISNGTWSIIGVESLVPFTGEDAYAAGLSNETGHGGTYCVQATITGMWLIQEILRLLADGSTGATLAAEAEAAAPFRSLIDPAHPRFLAPADMIAEIRAACAGAGDPVPETRGELARCAYDSLALLYRHTLRDLARITGRRFTRIHMVGGGSQARLLNRLCAAATGLPVMAGPTEATALGNAIVQFVTLGELSSVAEGRRLSAASFQPAPFEPWRPGGLDDAIARFERLRGH